jgi:hypothetical protein
LTNFGDSEVGHDGYRVLVPNDRAATRIDGPSGLPCFAGASHSL